MRANSVKAASEWSGNAADSVLLDFDDRHRRRMAMTGTHGTQFVLDLPEAMALRGGDALLLEDGRLIEVVAAAEPLMEIRGRDPHHLVQVAWHLGNRHLPTQIMPRSMRIRRDHVIAEMVRGLGAKVVEIEAAFDPEGGAYSGGGHHGHAHDAHDHAAHDQHGHDANAHSHARAHAHGAHSHAHAQSHNHSHDHAHSHDDHEHVHGPDCGHDHGR